jgi:hypothetical protein
VLVPGNSSVKVQPEILDIVLGELHVVYMDRGARFSSCDEFDVDRLGSVSFYSPFFNPILDCKWVGLQFL